MNRFSICKGPFVVIAAILLAGCADSLSFQEAQSADVVGFWHGLWHGMIAVPAFIGSLFSEDIAVYAIYNNGAWYDFGFLMGVGGSSSATAAGARFRN